ncbi:hypothetical protein [Nocardioides marmorisolisilvae]|uniref:Uncharacterized protein n=1 Tax=Nocardioides marmorisolisilvae TaxID=1542737 RepID=A0A3N0DUK5_9ACTN|nr:hypothetical protein [Nocardioides marmorisolisilvae]RNL79166.1 hypothetical protein EFL95_09050 [Nocardioides marmorisolisilvae]
MNSLARAAISDGEAKIRMLELAQMVLDPERADPRHPREVLAAEPDLAGIAFLAIGTVVVLFLEKDQDAVQFLRAMITQAREDLINLRLLAGGDHLG